MTTLGKDLPNEMDIFLRFTEGDRTAFKQLYDYHNPNLSSLIQRMVKMPDLTEEIIQEVWIYLWNNREKLITVKLPGSYIRRAALNRAFYHLKNIARDHKMMESIKAYSTELHDELQEMVDYKDSEKLIQQAVDELPAQRKKIWELSRNKNLSHEEIATQMGLTKSTVNNQITEASKHIRIYLENHGTLLALAALIIFFKK